MPATAIAVRVVSTDVARVQLLSSSVKPRFIQPEVDDVVNSIWRYRANGIQYQQQHNPNSAQVLDYSTNNYPLKVLPQHNDQK